MNPRIAKEARPLLLPWCAAALAAAGHFIALADSTFAKGAFGSFLTGLADVAFFVGCLVLTAMPLGSELHERTMALLLSQPTERTRLWKDKIMAATIAVIALGIVHGFAGALAGQVRIGEALAYAAFMTGAICSVGYWTLASGSILVGIACAVSIPAWIAGSFHVVVYYFLGLEVSVSEQTATVLLLALTVAYCAFFLWLGHRQFTRLELKAGAVSRAAQIPEALVPTKLTELFRCGPTSAMANLIRKEVRLQKPIFLVSAIFTVCWLVTLLVLLVRPAWRSDCIGVFNGLTGTQIVLMLILTGCVSLGDDKALGTTAWHLSLPISGRRQWLVKLLAAAATTVATAVVLPALLAALTSFKVQVGLLAFQRYQDALGLIVPCAGLFVLSFWSASMVANTVRAALTCMLALICIAACITFGATVPESFFGPPPGNYTGLQTGLITTILAHFQLPPNYLWGHPGVFAYCALFSCLVFVFAALFQSLKQFRRVQSKAAVKLKYAIVLAGITFVGTFWYMDLSKSIETPWRRFDAQIGRAIAAIPLREEMLEPGRDRTVTLHELDQTGKISDSTRTWLRGAQIEVTAFQPSPGRPRSQAASSLQVSITFPNGCMYSFNENINFPSYMMEPPPK